MPVSSSPICIWHAAGMPILASRMWATAPVLLLGLALFCEHRKPQSYSAVQAGDFTAALAMVGCMNTLGVCCVLQHLCDGQSRDPTVQTAQIGYLSPAPFILG